MAARTVVLRHNLEIPRVGFGTFKLQGDDAFKAVKYALSIGLRHIDTASIYKNEVQVAKALQDSGVPRADVFITSKVSPYEQGTERAEQACCAMLQRLEADYIDLVLIHWPGAAKTSPDSPDNAKLRKQTWRVLEKFYTDGKFKAIGVSNFEEQHLADLLEFAEVKPLVNQVEVHPRFPNKCLRDFSSRHGVAVVAYACLGGGDLLSNPVVKKVAGDVGKTPAQVLLRWALGEGCCVLAKSSNPSRIDEYAEDELLTWDLSPQDLNALSSLDDGHKYCWNPYGIA